MRTLRLERGWSLARLSERVHYSKGYLSRVENGSRMPSPELARLCDHTMGTDGELARLLAEAGPPEPAGRPADADGTEGAGAPAPPARPVPAQLPAAGRMWGRHGELARCEAFLARQRGPAVIALDGIGGIGKTTFAVSLARSLSRSYPDGALFADLRAHGRAGLPAAAGDIAAGLLRTLGPLTAQAPADPAERTALLRSALAERRVVVLLDDADSVAQVAPLLPAAGSSLFLVTSRIRLTALSVRHGALRLSLDPLATEEAVLLLRRELGRRAVPAAEDGRGAADAAAASDGADEVLAVIARRCAHLPLALQIAAERMAEQGPAAAPALAAELGRAGTRLDALALPGEAGAAVRPVFALSYRRLPADQARAFRLLALHPGAVAGVGAAAALLGEGTGTASRLLGELHAAHLLAEVEPGRYRMHDLLREYAGERVEAEETSQARADAVRRTFAWYLHTAEAAGDQLLGDGRHRPPVDPPPERCEPLRFCSTADALEWCETEHVNLLACAGAARTAGSAVAWQLPYSLWPFLFLRHHHLDQLNAGLVARRAADADTGPLAGACAEAVLASARAGLREHRAADVHYRRALELFAAAGDRVGEGAVLLAYAMSCVRQGRVAEAAGHVDRALELFTATGSTWGAASALVGIGEAHLVQGRPEAALAPLSLALELHRAHGSLWMQASTWTLIGTAHRERGDHAPAEDGYRRALELHGRTGMRAGTAHALHQLGSCLDAQGRVPQARRAWLRAWALYDHLGDPRARDLLVRLAALAPCRTAPPDGEGHPPSGGAVPLRE
ncbi:tetratricopeptide repeat protein [Streptomyces sp. NPDC096136]|uniref:tetratricopeptide repeat protein n=1 Tax=Streptomyces sp. NPDC096136 TaxID=3366076 RepID=UPI00380F877A